jgi:hypothetical protein
MSSYAQTMVRTPNSFQNTKTSAYLNMADSCSGVEIVKLLNHQLHRWAQITRPRHFQSTYFRFTPDSKATSQPTTNIEGSLPQPGPTIEHRIGNSPLTALQPPTREGFLFHHTHPLTAHVPHGMAAQPSTRRYVPSALRFSHHLHLQLLPPLSMRERKR